MENNDDNALLPLEQFYQVLNKHRLMVAPVDIRKLDPHPSQGHLNAVHVQKLVRDFKAVGVRHGQFPIVVIIQRDSDPQPLSLGQHQQILGRGLTPYPRTYWKYIILSGHHRVAALKMLNKDKNALSPNDWLWTAEIHLPGMSWVLVAESDVISCIGP
jgi:hypothetical protein